MSPRCTNCEPPGRGSPRTSVGEEWDTNGLTPGRNNPTGISYQFLGINDGGWRTVSVANPIKEGPLFGETRFGKFEVLPLVVDGRKGFGRVADQERVGEVVQEDVVAHVCDMVGKLLHEHRVSAGDSDLEVFPH